MLRIRSRCSRKHIVSCIVLVALSCRVVFHSWKTPVQNQDEVVDFQDTQESRMAAVVNRSTKHVFQYTEAANIETTRKSENKKEKESHWSTLQLSKKTQLYLYSAYQDLRQEMKNVRILGLAPNKYKENLQCILVDDSGTLIYSDAVLKQNKENWNLPWSSFFFTCPIKDGFKPSLVTLVQAQDKAGNQTVWKKVVSNDENMKSRNLTGMSVCVKPLHNHHDRAVWVLEFIEFYQLLGANHFYFYNHTIGPQVAAILRYYEEKNIVTVLSWDLPVKTKVKIRNEGQFTALNDCVYRSMWKYKYSAMVDLDEYIIPRKFDGIPSYLDTVSATNIGSFIFKNGFFYLYWENSTEYSSSKNMDLNPYLLTIYKTRRVSKLHNYGTRSKYVVKPDAVVEAGNHVVWQHMKGKISYKVPPDQGISQHYRICEFGGFECLKHPSEVDKTAHRWADRLFNAVADTCTAVFGDAGCPQAPPLGNPW